MKPRSIRSAIVLVITILTIVSQITQSLEDDYHAFAKFTFSVNHFGVEADFYSQIDQLLTHLGPRCMIPQDFAYDLVPSKAPMSYEFYVVLPDINDVESEFHSSCTRSHLENSRVMASDFDPFVMTSLTAQLVTYPSECVLYHQNHLHRKHFDEHEHDEDHGSDEGGSSASDSSSRRLDSKNHRGSQHAQNDDDTDGVISTYLCGHGCPPCGELVPCQSDLDCGYASYCVTMHTAEDAYEGAQYCSIVHDFDGRTSELKEAANASSRLLTSLILIVIMTAISLLTMFTYNIREDKKF